MTQIPQGLDPRETNGTSGETSKRGLYVFEAKDSFDNKVGDKKYLEANDPAQADAFVHQGWRQASLEEVQEYTKSIEEARAEARNALKSEQGIGDTLSETRESVLDAGDKVATDSKQAVAGTEAESADKTAKKETK